MSTGDDIPVPAGFESLTASIGIKDATDDVLLVRAAPGTTSAGVFTKSRFAGPSVTISRGVAATGRGRALVVISKNANVANGPEGDADARELQRRAAELLGVEPGEVYVASTGVIGRPYPMERIRTWFGGASTPGGALDPAAAATAIMTTDTHPKVASASVPTSDGGEASIVGIAKGVGMIEPDMATLLVFVFTDAQVDAPSLDASLRRVVDVTFNALSIDTDTSTSDSAVVMASGAAGRVDPAACEAGLLDVAERLVRMIAADGEGATKVVETTVRGARDAAQARRVAKAIVNSPLVKTAVHGADPNWGRIAMAIGKCSDELDIEPDRTVIGIGGVRMFPPAADEAALAAAAEHMAGDTIEIEVDLGIADGSFRAFGCDLTDGYVRINADYTT